MLNRNYSAGQPVPNMPGWAPVPMNQRAQVVMPPVTLPLTFAVPTATETPLMNPARPSCPLMLEMPGGSTYEGQPFDLVIAGTFQTAVTTPVQSGAGLLNLYFGNVLNSASRILVGSVGITGGSGYTSTPAVFYFRATLIADSLSGMLTGTYKLLTGYSSVTPANAMIAEVIIPTRPTGINFQNDPVFVFSLSSTPAVAVPTNTVTIKRFEILG